MRKTMNMTLANGVMGATVVTHPAPHHGDECIATAILEIVEGCVNVYRTRNLKQIEEAVANDAYIVDVGGVYDPTGNRFDHHQRDFAEVRPDGTKYSSAGLLWRKYGADACIVLTGCTQAQAEAAAKAVDETLIRGIDLADYGNRPEGQMSISQAISFMNLNWDESQDESDRAFQEACQLAHLVLVRTIRSAVAAEKGKDVVDEAIRSSENGILTLPQFVTGWLERATTSADPKAADLLYGVFRNVQGQWNVQALPPTLAERSAQRKPLPEAWHGLAGSALVETTGVADAIFCHDKRFICGAKTREGALALAKLAVEA